MSFGSTRAPWITWLGVLALWTLAFSLACRLAAGRPGGDFAAPGVALRLLGSTRQAAGDALFEHADVYFHKGVPHKVREALTNTWLQRLQGEIAPRLHLHAAGGEVAEILPWLRFAVAADPHQVDAFLVAAHFLATDLRRPDLAEQVLLEAQRHNPTDYRVLLEKARLWLRTRRFEQAANALDAALRCWPSGQDPSDRQTLLDKAEILTYRAVVHELRGDRAAAAACFRQVLALFPERTHLQRRVERLERGEGSGPDDGELLRSLFQRPGPAHCARENEDHA